MKSLEKFKITNQFLKMKISSIANMLLWVIRKGHLSTKLRSFSHGCFPSDRTDPKKISQSERQWTKSSQFHLSWPAIKRSICDFKIGDALNLKTQLSSDNISPLSLNYEKCIVLMCGIQQILCGEYSFASKWLWSGDHSKRWTRRMNTTVSFRLQNSCSNFKFINYTLCESPYPSLFKRVSATSCVEVFLRTDNLCSPSLWRKFKKGYKYLETIIFTWTRYICVLSLLSLSFFFFILLVTFHVNLSHFTVL